MIRKRQESATIKSSFLLQTADNQALLKSPEITQWSALLWIIPLTQLHLAPCICHHIRMVLFCFVFMVMQSCDSLTHILQGCLISLGCPSANEVTLKGMSKLGDTRSQWPFFHLGQQSIQSKMHKKYQIPYFLNKWCFPKIKFFQCIRKKYMKKSIVKIMWNMMSFILMPRKIAFALNSTLVFSRAQWVKPSLPHQQWINHYASLITTDPSSYSGSWSLDTPKYTIRILWPLVSPKLQSWGRLPVKLACPEKCTDRPDWQLNGIDENSVLKYYSPGWLWH